MSVGTEPGRLNPLWAPECLRDICRLWEWSYLLLWLNSASLSLCFSVSWSKIALAGWRGRKHLCLEIENLVLCSGPANFFLSDLGK